MVQKLAIIPLLHVLKVRRWVGGSSLKTSLPNIKMTPVEILEQLLEQIVSAKLLFLIPIVQVFDSFT